MGDCQFTIAPMSLCKWVTSYGTRPLKNGTILFQAKFTNDMELLASCRGSGSKRLIRVFDKEFEVTYDVGLCVQFDIVDARYEVLGFGVSIHTDWLFNVLGNLALLRDGRALWNGCEISVEKAKREYIKALALG